MFLFVPSSNITKENNFSKYCVAEASECLCIDYQFVNDSDYQEFGDAWAYAYVEGSICIPSDGNLHGAWGYGTGGPKLRDADFVYSEMGCNGDYAYAWSYGEMGEAYALAAVGAPPCCVG